MPFSSEIDASVLRIKNSINLDLTFDAPFSLISAKGGAILFYAYLFRYTQDRQQWVIMNDLLNHSIEQVEGQASGDFTLANGHTGLGWLIQHLANIKLIDIEDDYLDDFHEVIMDSCVQDKKNGNYDLLYGLIGKGMFFLERLPRKTAVFGLNEVLAGIEDMAMKVGKKKLYWTTPFEENRVNLGLAHGVASVLAFLAKVFNAGVSQERVQSMVTRVVNYLLEDVPRSTGSGWFPTYIQGNKARSLAWCQGDLGIVKALMDAHLILPTYPALRQLVYELTESIRGRQFTDSDIDATASGQVDSTFCHGTAGALHLINRINHHGFQMPVSYWTNLTIKHVAKNAIDGQSKSGALFFVNEKAEWIEDTGLLYGSTGIGLCLLSVLKPEFRQWDSIFLTN